MIYTLLNTSGITTANWGGDPISTNRRTGEALVQTTVRGTATIEIQGRMTNGSEWHVIDTATQSDSTVATRIAVFPQMRAVVTSVNTATTASGGVSSTPATGSISISDNPSGVMSPTLIVILGTTATAAKEVLTFGGDASDEETLQVVTDGAGEALNFEFDTASQAYTGTVVFSGTAVAGDTVSISDISGKSRGYNFVTTAGDSTDSTATEVLVGNGTTGAATNFQAAVEADWLLNRIQISPTVSSSTVTLTQAALADTGESAPVETTINRYSAITSTAWTGGTTGYTLDDSTYIPIALGAGVGAEAARDSAYVALTNEVAKGNLTVVNVTKSGLTTSSLLTVEMKTAGTHHSTGASTTLALPLNIDEGGANISLASTAGADGTNSIKLEINDTGTTPTSGYTLIARDDGDEVEVITANIATALAATSWSGGNITATNDYNNKSVTLQAAGSSLTSFGNETIQVVKDPHNIITTTGMSNGSAGVTVLCNLDVPQSS